MTALGWRIFIRSLFVQSSWNFTGMQNLGFFFSTWPALARRNLPAPELTRIGVRHLRTFNTHPYFAGLVAATVVREEESGLAEESVDGLKRSLMGVLGSVGDEFFWATLRPFAAVISLPAALAGAAWAPLIMFAAYNIPHVAVRIWGVSMGLARGKGIVEMLQRRPLSRALPALGVSTTVVTGFLIGAGALDRSWSLLPGRGPLSVGAAVSVFALLLGIQDRGLGQGRLLAGLSALAAISGVALVVHAP